MGVSNAYGMLALFNGNKTSSAITTKYSGIDIVFLRDRYQRRGCS
jgi:hypothetical protein